MAAPYFFSGLIPDAGSFWVEETTARHIVQVLRMSTGETVLLTDGKGLRVRATILETNKKGCRVHMEDKTADPPPAAPATLALSLLKNTTRFEWFLEKATELGISRIVPLRCRRTEKQHFREDRMTSILTSALIQSRQTWLPVLEPPVDFSTFAGTARTGVSGIAHCEPAEKVLLKQFLQTAVGPRCIAIGPEGDFTPEEIALAKTNHFQEISLGGQRLRSETAAVAASVLLQLG